MADINPFDQRAMIEVLETIYSPSTFLLSTFFAREQVHDTDTVDVDVIVGNRKMAPFVSPLREGKVVERRGYSTKSFKPAYIKEKMVHKPSDFMDRLPGQTIYGDHQTPAQRSAAVVGQDLAEMNDMITRREEWMASKALMDGSVTITGEGVNATIDFQRPSANTVSLLAGSRWNEDAATIQANFRAWAKIIRKATNMNPTVAVLGIDACEAMYADSTLLSVLDKRRVDMGMINPQTLPEGVTYIGHLLDPGIDLYRYENWYYDEDTETDVEFIGAKKVLLGCPQARSVRHYGVIEDLDATGEVTLAAMRRFPKTWTTPDPSTRTIMVQSAPLPVTHQPDAFVSATVLA